MRPDTRIHPWPTEDPNLRARWRELVDRLDLNPTMGPAWIDVASGALGCSDSQLAVFVDGSDGSTLSGIVPFLRSRRRMAGFSVTVIEPACNLMSYHAEIVSEGEIQSLMRRFLVAMPPWDLLQMSNVVTDGPTGSAIRGLADEMRAPVQVIPGDVSPYLVIHGTWQEYLATKSKKFRYKLRRRREMLGQNQDWQLIWHDSIETEVLLDSIVTIEERSWKAKAGIDIPSNPKELAYHRRLLPCLAEQGLLLANVLHYQGQPVAYNLCCHSKGWVGQLKTAFDERFAEFSPGSLVIDASIERAFALRAREFDFLGDADAHKLAWTSDTRAHASYFLFAPRLKARLIGNLKALKARVMPPGHEAEFGPPNDGQSRSVGRSRLKST